MDGKNTQTSARKVPQTQSSFAGFNSLDSRRPTSATEKGLVMDGVSEVSFFWHIIRGTMLRMYIMVYLSLIDL